MLVIINLGKLLSSPVNIECGLKRPSSVPPTISISLQGISKQFSWSTGDAKKRINSLLSDKKKTHCCWSPCSYPKSEVETLTHTDIGIVVRYCVVSLVIELFTHLGVSNYWRQTFICKNFKSKTWQLEVKRTWLIEGTHWVSDRARRWWVSIWTAMLLPRKSFSSRLVYDTFLAFVCNIHRVFQWLSVPCMKSHTWLPGYVWPLMVCSLLTHKYFHRHRYASRPTAVFRCSFCFLIPRRVYNVVLFNPMVLASP